jgi:hypothetical protein
MLGEIAAGLSSLKAATDIVKGLNAANTQAAINDVKLDLQARIFDAREALTAAQEAQAAALSRIRELEQEIVQMKNWEGEKQRYEFKELATGVTAYVVKEAMRGTEPEHQICANCYQQGKKSILQAEFWPVGRASVLVCHGCGSVLYVKGQPHESHKALKPAIRR